MAVEGSTIGKIVDKFTGSLEKMVDVRMLVLGISLLLYTDAWLIFTNTDIASTTFDDALSKMKSLTIRRAVVFVVAYSMLMTLVIPVFRYVANYARFLIDAGGGPDEPRPLEAKRLSDWSAAVLALCAWTGFVGYFKQPDEYRGLVVYAFDGISSGDSITIVFFRFAVLFFLWFCFMNAWEREV